MFDRIQLWNHLSLEFSLLVAFKLLISFFMYFTYIQILYFFFSELQQFVSSPDLSIFSWGTWYVSILVFLVLLCKFYYFWKLCNDALPSLSFLILVISLSYFLGKSNSKCANLVIFQRTNILIFVYWLPIFYSGNSTLCCFLPHVWFIIFLP